MKDINILKINFYVTMYLSIFIVAPCFLYYLGTGQLNSHELSLTQVFNQCNGNFFCYLLFGFGIVYDFMLIISIFTGIGLFAIAICEGSESQENK